MEREITPGVKRKVKALRKRYCEGLCSDYFIETGIPIIYAERLEQSKEDIKPLLKENDKRVKEAIANASKRKGRRTKKEDQLIFI